MGNAYMVVGTSEGEERLGRTRHRWKNGIKMDLEKEIGKLRISSISFSIETNCEHDSKLLDYTKG
jgi:hypothetical protein